MRPLPLLTITSLFLLAAACAADPYDGGPNDERNDDLGSRTVEFFPSDTAVFVDGEGTYSITTEVQSDSSFVDSMSDSLLVDRAMLDSVFSVTLGFADKSSDQVYASQVELLRNGEWEILEAEEKRPLWMLVQIRHDREGGFFIGGLAIDATEFPVLDSLIFPTFGNVDYHIGPVDGLRILMTPIADAGKPLQGIYQQDYVVEVVE